MLSLGFNLKLGLPLLLISFVVAGLVLYGGAQLVAEDEDAEEPTVSDDVIAADSATIVAEGIAFNESTVAAKAGAEFTITMENRDAGVPHNIAFYTDRSASQAIFVSEIYSGVETRDFTFPAPAAPGNYFFRCDVHPDSMTGTFVVQ